MWVVLLGALVVAAPPFIQSESSTGLQIEFPLNEYTELDTAHNFHFHIFNASSGAPVFNDSIECHFHLYDPMGGHLYKLENISVMDDTFDFEVPVSAGNFSVLGDSPYIFQCNGLDNTYGGFVSSSIEVTNTGAETDDTGLPLILGMVLVSFVLAYIGKSIMDKHFLLTGLLFAMAILILVLVPTYLITDNAGISVSFLKILMWSLRLMALYFFVYLIYSIFMKSERLQKMAGRF